MAQLADQPDTTTRSDPSIKCPTLHHYGIWTTQPGEILDWYAKVVGLEINLASQTGYGTRDGLGSSRADVDPNTPVGIWASNDSQNHRIAITRTPGMEKEDSSKTITHDRVGHTAWEYPTLSDLLESYERIRDLDIHPVLCAHHGVSVAFYYRDPDGNVVELLADPFGDASRSREYMRTSDAMRANTMGTYIDPEQMLALHKAGASADDLQTRAFAGEFIPDVLPSPVVLF